jgi:preprotein translocase subunit SecA
MFQFNRVNKQVLKIVNEINSLEESFKTLTDLELKNKTFQLKEKYKVEKSIDKSTDSILPQSFALIREASIRSLGLRHYDVQLIGGLILNEGKIAEMATGEGKTLVSTLSAYHNALAGEGVHIITVNDYLANRDRHWMGQIHNFLGLDVGLIQQKMSSKKRRDNYNSDITYVTNSELGFDYLRDSRVFHQRDIVKKRPFNYCIIDEIDSILIDESRTPLILSAPEKTPIDKYIVAAEIPKYLDLIVHYERDEKRKNVILTEQGFKRIEEILGVSDLYNKKDPWIPYIMNALKAEAFYSKGKDYIVQNNEVLIVDQFTGRIMPDRRWSNGLHQAVEAKEELPIRNDSRTQASITYQGLFRLYSKLSGMTGTAKTAEYEFEKFYNLQVETVPTAKPNIRQDLPDRIFKDELTKWKAVVEECKRINRIGRPILVGTTSVEKSEILSELLTESGLKHSILNAKPENIKKEAATIAKAGLKNAITIATNMAGRGTDIILGGNIEYKSKVIVYTILRKLKTNILTLDTLGEYDNKLGSQGKKMLNDLILDKNFQEQSNSVLVQLLQEVNPKSNDNDSKKNKTKKLLQLMVREVMINYEDEFNSDSQRIKQLGGLYVLGTERHESRRIDDQLRGRCGRQGDPGTSCFFLSLDDEIFRVFGGAKIQQVQSLMAGQDDMAIETAFLTKPLNNIQKQVEEYYFDIRKQSSEYDEVLNDQRKLILKMRSAILRSNFLKPHFQGFMIILIDGILNDVANIPFNEIQSTLKNMFGIELDLELLDYKIDHKRFKQLIKNSNFKKTSATVNIEQMTMVELTKSGAFLFDKYELGLVLLKEFLITYELKEMVFDIHWSGLSRELERCLTLFWLDRLWEDHIDTMDALRDTVSWRAYGQRNPLYEYREEAYLLYKEITETFPQLVFWDILNGKIL